MPRIVHFEIPYDDGHRAKEFYGSVFGWEIQGWGDEPTYQLANTAAGGDGPGIDGALYKRQERDYGILVYVDVADIDAYLARAAAAGAEIVVGRQAVPNVGWSAVLRDPEGNFVGLFEDDPSAGAA